MSELKPCPFCGGEAEKKGQSYEGKNYVFILCSRCGASGPIRIVRQTRVRDEDNPAIEAWNRRTEVTE